MRNLQISYFRVIAMLMVIFYHCLCYYGIWPDSPITIPSYIGLCKFMNSIDMPVFFILSAYLYTDKLLNTDKYNNSKEFMRKKLKRLLLPYLFWGIVINLLFINRYHFISILYGISHLWFLLTLMMVFLIVHLTRTRWIKMTLPSLYALTFLLYVITPLRELIPGNLLTIKQTLQYLPFFFVGIILARSKSSIESFPVKNHKYLIIILLMSLFLSIFLAFYQTDYHLADKICKYIIIPFLSTFIISAFWILCQHIHFKNLTIIKSLDYNSMGIYIIHHILIISAISNNQISILMRSHYIVSPMVLFIVVLSISWGISFLINRYKFSSYILG